LSHFQNRELLQSNPNQVWFSQQPDKQNAWPDAWCEVCERRFEKHGEWNELNGKKPALKWFATAARRIFVYKRSKIFSRIS